MFGRCHDIMASGQRITENLFVGVELAMFGRVSNIPNNPKLRTPDRFELKLRLHSSLMIT